MIFNSLLIANRGEIAVRIIETAHEMGIRCIAVYVDADADAPFVRAADEAFRLPDGGYLDGNLILDTANKTGISENHLNMTIIIFFYFILFHMIMLNKNENTFINYYIMNGI